MQTGTVACLCDLDACLLGLPGASSCSPHVLQPRGLALSRVCSCTSVTPAPGSEQQYTPLVGSTPPFLLMPCLLHVAWPRTPPLPSLPVCLAQGLAAAAFSPSVAALQSSAGDTSCVRAAAHVLRPRPATHGVRQCCVYGSAAAACGQCMIGITVRRGRGDAGPGGGTTHKLARAAWR